MTFETSKLNIRLQSTVSLSSQARSTDYSKMSSKSAAATNNFLVLNEPTKKVQDYKQMKPNGAVSWVWDHFSVYDPKYNRKSQAVWPLPVPPDPLPVPDFASKVRLGRQGWPAEASGLRPSALASRPPALKKRDPGI